LDKLTSMAVYVRVVDENSFAAAARHFRFSPSVVSAHVQELEDRLGVRLLNRTTRRLNLTDVGRVYYERCKQIIAEIEEAEQMASELQVAPRGVLRITAVPAFSVMHLAPAIADFTALYPEISVELTLNDRFVDLVEAGLDLAIQREPSSESNLIARRIVRVRTVLCGAPAYLDRRGTPLLPADLAAHNCLTGPPSNSRWRLVDAEGHEQTLEVSGNLYSNSNQVLRAAALEGQGLILVPVFLVGEDLRNGGLVPVLDGYAPDEVSVYALYPHSRHLSAKVRVFIDFLVARFARDPDWNDWHVGAPVEMAADDLIF
jgi:DNA-binding transcriptional LysR family regulator